MKKNLLSEGDWENVTNVQLAYAWIPIQALIMFYYNTDFDDFFKIVWQKSKEDVHTDYYHEKLDMWRMGLHRFWGSMDYLHQLRLIDAAILKYANEAENHQRINARYFIDGEL